mmetsp:Transcript_62383/g.135437  ORF Transcript_62383/g.135437 Transcript_62383/m.135437 type:complete len:200 (+) Transcript_62383:406-1005(+)
MAAARAPRQRPRGSRRVLTWAWAKACRSPCSGISPPESSRKASRGKVRATTRRSLGTALGTMPPGSSHRLSRRAALARLRASRVAGVNKARGSQALAGGIRPSVPTRARMQAGASSRRVQLQARSGMTPPGLSNLRATGVCRARPSRPSRADGVLRAKVSRRAPGTSRARLSLKEGRWRSSADSSCRSSRRSRSGSSSS